MDARSTAARFCSLHFMGKLLKITLSYAAEEAPMMKRNSSGRKRKLEFLQKRVVERYLDSGHCLLIMKIVSV